MFKISPVIPPAAIKAIMPPTAIKAIMPPTAIKAIMAIFLPSPLVFLPSAWQTEVCLF